MSRRIPQRTRIYLGCEGESEQAYGKVLNQVADAVGLPLYLDCDVLQPGGGDPLALVQLAIRRISEKVSKRGLFANCAVLLDRDRLGQSPGRDAQITNLAVRHEIQLVWQNPCHESFLLRHLAGQEAMRPPTSELAMQALKRRWPEYRKGMPANELAAQIDLSAVRHATEVEQDLLAFLEEIGLADRLR